MKNLKEIRENKGLTQVEVAKALGISKQAYNNYEHGRREADYEMLLKLAEFFNTTVENLLTGENAANVSEILPSDNIHSIPIYESVSAGFGACANDNIIGYIPLFITSPQEAAETLIIRVRGDSMFPRISDGDLIQVHKQDYADNGNVVVMLIDGTEAVVKRYFCDTAREEVRLESYNPSYPPRVFRGREIERLRILGVARRVMSEL